MSGYRSARRTGVGTVVFAIVLVVIGGYYVLRNTLGLDLPELDSDQVVPIIAVVIGLALLYRAWTDREAGQAPADRLR